MKRVAPLRCLVQMVFLACFSQAQAQSFLKVDQAFSLSMTTAGPHELSAVFQAAPGVYLYKERISAKLVGAPSGQDVALKVGLPSGTKKYDPTFNKTMEVYHGATYVSLEIPRNVRGRQAISVTYQGCAEAGLCYPPQSKRFALTAGAQGGVISVEPYDAAEPPQLKRGLPTLTMPGLGGEKTAP